MTPSDGKLRSIAETSGVRLAGVIGAPIAHSLSPSIHNEWAAREGASAHYIPLYVPDHDDAFTEAVDALKKLGFRGVNVTLPHKESAFRIADRRTPTAEQIGAANMLTFSDDGIVADNSDAEGFAATLKNLFGDRAPSAPSALVLGAGGSARAVVVALKTLAGCEQVTIANRTKEKAEAVAKHNGATVENWDARHDLVAAHDIIVNTTSLGMTGKSPLDVNLAALREGSAVIDIIYTPLKTALLKAAEDHGARTANGLEMLIRQAVPGYKSWLGKTATVDDALRSMLVSKLSHRR